MTITLQTEIVNYRELQFIEPGNSFLNMPFSLKNYSS